MVDVLSLVGSLWTSFFGIGNILTLAFSYNLMMSSLIRQLYHFEPHPDEEGKVDKGFKNKVKKKTPFFEAAEEDDDENLKQAREKHAAEMKQRQNGLKAIKDSMEKTLGMKRRAKFNHLTGGVLGMYVCCYYFRPRKALSKLKGIGRNTFFFLKGLDRLNKEADL
jgi:hypothetical protein